MEHARFVDNYYGTLKDYVQKVRERIINERLEKAKKEIGIKDFYQYSVINNTPEQCAEDIKKIIVEHLK